ncbi:MAG: bifunctional ADP-heptose synthase [Bacteriovoracaceae bacterium]|jgi:rfaE bifunctional protein kinase chain/domain|nr:bifunctional ADP-heptose synthase [Bacteriovoracaceae bacterium]
MISKDRFKSIIDNFSTIDPVLVVGDVGVDKYSSGQVNRISPEAPVPILEVKKEWLKLGLATNVSDNLKSLGVNSTICGVIGDDKNANVLESLLDDSGLKTWGILRDADRMTTFKERVVTDTQQICRIDYETKEPIGNDTTSRLIERIDEFIPTHSAVILEDYGKGLVTERICSHLFSHCKEHGKMICVDPSRTTPVHWYKGATLLKPNHLEAKLMVNALGYNSDVAPVELAKILIDKLSLEKVIITLGAKGMGMLDTKGSGEFTEIPTVAREVFDVSGAGDTAISTIVAAMSAGANLEEAGWLGNCASGVVVGKKGTALVTTDELVSYFERIKTK